MTVAVPFALIGLDHVVLRVFDLVVVRTFYQNVLGCTLERQQDDIGLCQLRAGRSLIDLVAVAGKLGTTGGRGPAADGHNMDHIAIAIDPFEEDAIRSHLATFAVAPDESGIRYGADGDGPSIYIRDPEGNRVELKGPPAR
ncbi:VOC family protein [Sphingopyxis sp.]|uniref:VOC family protein n=1 Tax=Sphingopyxis sp. TaxID=1908224 RepID=UPI003D0C561C